MEREGQGGMEGVKGGKNVHHIEEGGMDMDRGRVGQTIIANHATSTDIVVAIRRGRHEMAGAVTLSETEAEKGGILEAMGRR
mmetsp:Transcript_17392/g.43328  ORF Transcript_17392/g.43328 Transcript_17392/m.43328 type:complete len:82 (-) Transcript_17392:200-445(-)